MSADVADGTTVPAFVGILVIGTGVADALPPSGVREGRGVRVAAMTGTLVVGIEVEEGGTGVAVGCGVAVGGVLEQAARLNSSAKISDKPLYPARKGLSANGVTLNIGR